MFALTLSRVGAYPQLQQEALTLSMVEFAMGDKLSLLNET